MTLTVRLDATVESALERYCTERGVTKSLVVQECLAGYLPADQAQAANARHASVAKPPAPVSATFKAFADACFIGAGELRGGSADKAAVRARAMQRIRRTAE